MLSIRSGIALVFATVLFALPAVCQTPLTYSLEAGAGAYLSSTPHSAGDISILVGPETSRVANYTTFEIRPINSQQPVVTGRSGIQYTVASSGKLELAGLVQGGGSYNQVGTTAAFAGGGKISIYPGWKKFPGLYFAVVGQALGDSAAGWDPQGSVRIAYQFSGLSAARSLKTRRALAALAKDKILPATTKGAKR